MWQDRLLIVMLRGSIEKKGFLPQPIGEPMRNREHGKRSIKEFCERLGAEDGNHCRSQVVNCSLIVIFGVRHAKHEPSQ